MRQLSDCGTFNIIFLLHKRNINSKTIMTQHLSHPSAPALHPQYGIVSEEKIVKRQAFNTRNWDTALNKNMFCCVKPEHKSYEKWSCLSDLKKNKSD